MWLVDPMFFWSQLEFEIIEEEMEKNKDTEEDLLGYTPSERQLFDKMQSTPVPSNPLYLTPPVSVSQFGSGKGTAKKRVQVRNLKTIIIFYFLCLHCLVKWFFFFKALFDGNCSVSLSKMINQIHALLNFRDWKFIKEEEEDK